MNLFVRTVSIASALALAACSSPSMMNGPVVGQTPTVAPVIQQPEVLSPGQTTAVARAMTDIGPYVDPAALALMGENDRTQAASAQFNALQFGRPGPGRAWTGGSGVGGSIEVGPYVRVNNLDCRSFTHTVTAAGQSYVRKGTACRENGLWSVVSTASAV